MVSGCTVNWRSCPRNQENDEGRESLYLHRRHQCWHPCVMDGSQRRTRSKEYVLSFLFYISYHTAQFVASACFLFFSVLSTYTHSNTLVWLWCKEPAAISMPVPSVPSLPLPPSPAEAPGGQRRNSHHNCLFYPSGRPSKEPVAFLI